MCRLYRTYVGERRHKVDVLATVGDGIDALEVCSRHVPDVVVMDIRMPRMNGIEATRRLREEH